MYSHSVWAVHWLQKPLLVLTDSSHYLSITELRVREGALTHHLPQQDSERPGGEQFDWWVSSEEESSLTDGGSNSKNSVFAEGKGLIGEKLLKKASAL